MPENTILTNKEIQSGSKLLNKYRQISLHENIVKYKISSNIFRYRQISSNIVRYCQISSDIVRYCQILSDTVRYCQILSDIVKYHKTYKSSTLLDRFTFYPFSTTYISTKNTEELKLKSL